MAFFRYRCEKSKRNERSFRVEIEGSSTGNLTSRTTLLAKNEPSSPRRTVHKIFRVELVENLASATPLVRIVHFIFILWSPRFRRPLRCCGSRDRKETPVPGKTLLTFINIAILLKCHFFRFACYDVVASKERLYTASRLWTNDSKKKRWRRAR